MGRSAGRLLLALSLFALQALADGSNALAVGSWQHARQLQSSCDTSSFQELKPVSNAAAES
jgi:hypothetical protein